MRANKFTLLAVVVVTFLATRFIDQLNLPVPRELPIAVTVSDGTSRNAAPAAQLPSAAPAISGSGSTNRGAYFAVIGFPVGIDQRNRDRRALLRELWYPEYRNIGVTIRAEFVIGLLTYQGDGHKPAIVQGLYEEHRAHSDMAFVNAREATRDPYRGDPKCTGEKLVAWFQQVVVVHREAKFFLKADWDTWVHTVRLEAHLRQPALLSGPAYFGNTLWCSYSVDDFQPCGYGFGPLQAHGARKVECPPLRRGGMRAVGPFPYAAGLFWGLSYDVVEWMAGSRLVVDFARNASARFSPPYWIKGEDSAFGFFVHVSPFTALTPRHWGWNVVHDGWEFRSAKERGLCTQRVTNHTIAVHSMHTRDDFLLARSQLRERCGAACEAAIQPFEVDGLKDLCARNPNIPKVYSKCAAVGYPAPKFAADATGDGPTRLQHEALPRPNCRSEGANVPFLATQAEGGTIVCE